jgi:uncharacterized ferredoxin-like protein
VATEENMPRDRSAVEIVLRLMGLAARTAPKSIAMEPRDPDCLQ